MKKLIILVLFAFVSSFVMAQDDTTKQELSHTIYKDVKGVIKDLADALKVGTEHVYEVLVKQQLVDSITYLLLYGVFLFFIIWLTRNGNVLEKKGGHRTREEDDLMQWFYVPAVILSILLAVFFLFTISTVVTGFINPEYGAITKIIEMLK